MEMREVARKTKRNQMRGDAEAPSLMTACVFRKRFVNCLNDSKAFVPEWNCN